LKTTDSQLLESQSQRPRKDKRNGTKRLTEERTTTTTKPTDCTSKNKNPTISNEKFWQLKNYQAQSIKDLEDKNKNKLTKKIKKLQNKQNNTFKKGSDLGEFFFDHFLEFRIVLDSLFGLAVDQDAHFFEDFQKWLCLGIVFFHS
jgi:hypothetical protein